MNRLEPAVRAVMQSLQIKQLSDAALKTGIAKSALSKILRGDIGISPENLRKLVTGLSSEPAHQFHILAAHLYDEAERGSDLAPKISIEMKDTPAEAIGFIDLPTQLQHELRVIADRIKSGDEGLGSAISWFARAIEPTNEEKFPTAEEKIIMAAEAPQPAGLSPADQIIAAEAAKRASAKPGAPYPKPSKR